MSVMLSQKSLPLWARASLFLVLVGFILAPRLTGLDRFVTPDEPAWLGRSASFYAALRGGNFNATFQHSHPGVTITWLGTVAYLWKYPALEREAPPSVLKNWKNLEPFLREQGFDPLEILTTSRILLVSVHVITLALAFYYAQRITGFMPALTGFTLLALDPFHIGLTRLLHLDGLVSNLMFLATLVFIYYQFHSQHLLHLVLAGLVAGFSWLTKSPAFYLASFFGILALFAAWGDWQSNRTPAWHLICKYLLPLLLCYLIASVAFVMFWPAMWVDPLGTLQKIFLQAFTYATEGHPSAIFFNGRVSEGDPGWYFYIFAFLWRSTPTILAGLGFALCAFFLRDDQLIPFRARQLIGFLLIFSLLFAALISVGEKKFDRYLLPAMVPLAFISGLGWYMAFRWLWSTRSRVLIKGVVIALFMVLFGSQGYFTGISAPYYLSYYNPLLGGSHKAPQVMMVGWGEGLDQVARYLDDKPDVEALQVMTPYPEGSFSYYFRGMALEQLQEWEGPESTQLRDVDYLVLYINQWQRQRPDPAMLAYFNSQLPEFVVRINEIEYARLYRLHK